MEQWKEIKECENYLISNTGKIKHKRLNRLLSPQENKGGYLICGIYKGKKRKFILLHRAVLESFGPRRLNGTACNHVDGNKKNNNIHNLEWVTRSENQIHAHRLGLAEKSGANNPRAKLTFKDVKEIRALLKEGGLLKREITSRFNVNPGAMWFLETGRTWTDAF